MRTLSKILPFFAAFYLSLGSAYAMTDVNIINQLSDSDSLTVNGHAISPGESKTEGIDIFTSTMPIKVCTSDDSCKLFELKDDHKPCDLLSLGRGERIISSWHFEMLVDGRKISTWCGDINDPFAFFGDPIIHAKLRFFSEEGSYHLILTGAPTGNLSSTRPALGSYYDPLTYSWQ